MTPPKAAATPKRATGAAKSGAAKSGVAKAAVAKTAVAKSGVAKSGVAKSGVAKGRAARPVTSSPVGPFPIPAVGPPRPVRLPAVADYTLDNGLRVLVARRPGIPRFECRLLVPTARGDAGDAARLRVLTETVLSGTPGRSSRAIAEELQGMGAGLGTSADAEQLIICGSSLSLHRPGSYGTCSGTSSATRRFHPGRRPSSGTGSCRRSPSSAASPVWSPTTA